MAAAFLLAGASAVVAPLWAINDETAKQIALGFYAAAGDGGGAPAEFFRHQRAANPDPPASQTYLAYLFYGHPPLRIEVEQRDGQRL